MGLKKSKLSSRDLKEIISNTNYCKKDIRSLYETFEKDHPNRKVTLQEFQQVFSQLFPEGDCDAFAGHVFRTYDCDRSGSIDFREYILGMYVMSSGTLDERLQWAYRLFDKDDDGQVTKTEMLEIITAIYKVVGKMIMATPVKDGMSAQERMEKIFTKVDIDGDVCISYEEFRKAAWEDSSVVELLQLRGTLSTVPKEI